MITDRDMRDQVRQTLAGNEAGFDINAIVDEIQAKHGTINIEHIDARLYWEIVHRHAH